MPLIHSVPATAQPPCEIALGAVHPALRPYVLGYSGFRSGSGRPVAHLLLPFACPTVIIDFGSRSGLVSGARGTATTEGETTWGHGVGVAVTPVGAAALFGMPMSELTGGRPALADLLGSAVTELPGRLAAAPTWAERFALLEAVLAGRLGLLPAVGRAGATGTAGGGRAAAGMGAPGRAVVAPPDAAVRRAWRRLQQPDCPRVGPLAAELGVGRRRLERSFRQHIGLTPATVARIARFQRAVHEVGRGAGLAAAAAVSGYADQPHLTRDTRALTGRTPAELAVLLEQPVRAA